MITKSCWVREICKNCRGQQPHGLQAFHLDSNPNITSRDPCGEWRSILVRKTWVLFLHLEKKSGIYLHLFQLVHLKHCILDTVVKQGGLVRHFPSFATTRNNKSVVLSACPAHQSNCTLVWTLLRKDALFNSDRPNNLNKPLQLQLRTRFCRGPWEMGIHLSPGPSYPCLLVLGFPLMEYYPDCDTGTGLRHFPGALLQTSTSHFPHL